MIKKMRLKGSVKLNDQNQMTFVGNLHDNTSFSILVSEYDVQSNGNLNEKDFSIPAFLFVTQEAQQDHRCYVTLPQPDLRFGRHVMVHRSNLIQPSLKLENFKPRSNKAKQETKEVDKSKQLSLFERLFQRKK